MVYRNNGKQKVAMFDEKLTALQMKVPTWRFSKIAMADVLAWMAHLRFFSPKSMWTLKNTDPKSYLVLSSRGLQSAVGHIVFTLRIMTREKNNDQRGFSCRGRQKHSSTTAFDQNEDKLSMFISYKWGKIQWSKKYQSWSSHIWFFLSALCRFLPPSHILPATLTSQTHLLNLE